MDRYSFINALVNDGEGGGGAGAGSIVTQEELQTALAGKQDTITLGDGMSNDGDTLNVDNPVRGIMTQEEFDALDSDVKDKGTYFIHGESGGWVSPKMTANNLPVPYVATASSNMPLYGSSGAFAVFDDNPNTFWANSPDDSNIWIALDFGEQKKYRDCRCRVDQM